MKFSDLIELFVERDEPRPATNDDLLEAAREDHSSLADIARIVRELDGQYEFDRVERRRRG